MPALLKSRFSCFYCGNRTPFLKDGRTRKFNCPSCAATNHLDQNGQITDPPTTPSVAHTDTYAHPRPRTTSPTSHLTDDGLFCKTCLKNQHLLTTCLSEYLPADDDPEYEKYEAQYPQYRKELERRYPQVCPQCAPKVQERIRKTGHAAKIDFLAKTLERSKTSSVATPSTYVAWMTYGSNLVAFTWWASMLFQMLWHALGLLGVDGDNRHVANMTPTMVVTCTATALQARHLPTGCDHLLSSILQSFLLFSLLTLWWNPAMTHRLRFPHRSNQTTGLADFYRFQIAILLIRFVAWLKLHPLQTSESADLTRAAHGCMLAFLLFAALTSQRIINYNSAPKISFKDTTGPLLDTDSFQYPTETFTSQSSSQPLVSSLRHASPPSRQPFSIASLGSRQDRPSRQQSTFASTLNAPPTPPPDSDTESYTAEPVDSMDWEPITQSSSPLRSRTTQIPPQRSPLAAIPSFLRPATHAGFSEKSPFTGRLPPAPMSPAHRLRNPPAPPQFKPTPLSKQADFFKQMGLSSSTLPTLSSRAKEQRRDADGEDDDDNGNNKENQTSFLTTSTKADKDFFRPAQWTLKSDLDAAAKGTGLEDMFTRSFSIGDEPSMRRANARFSSGGDGREVLDASAAAAAAETRRNAAAGIAHRNANAAVWPIVFAVLAVGVAVFREPVVREWVKGAIWGGG